MRKVAVLAAMTLLLGLFAACEIQAGAASPAPGPASDPQAAETERIPIETARIGVATGTTGEAYVTEHFGTATISSFDDIMDATVALSSGKVDYVVTADITAYNIAAENPQLEVRPGEVLVDEEVGAGLRKEDTALLEEFNAFIAQIKADGTLADMEERWISPDRAPLEEIEIPEATGPLLRVGVCATREPFVYKDSNGKIAGFAPELARRFAGEAGYQIEFVDLKFGALITALQSGKVDIIIDLMTATEERKKSINFSDIYYLSGQLVLQSKQTASAAADSAGQFRPEDFDGKEIAILTGSMLIEVLEEHLPGATPVYFNNINDSGEALKTGKVDAILDDDSTLRKYLTNNPELQTLQPLVTEEVYGVVVSQEDPELLAQLNAFLAQLKADGTYDDMLRRWLDEEETPPMPNIPTTGENGKLTLATCGIINGFSYMDSNQVVGFDIELARRFAQSLGKDLEISTMDFGGMIPAVKSGKADLAASLITITEERKQNVAFSDPYYYGGVALCVPGSGTVAEAAAPTSFWARTKASFHQNLIVENRWQLILEGLGVTILISVFAFLLATLLGFFICFLTMNRNFVLSALGRAYVTLLRGTPIVVILMIIYYVVFAKLNINSIIVAIIAYGLNGGAYVSEIIRSAINTVDKGQVEAARSMGFTRAQAFFTVTFPQAVRRALPVYKSEFVSMVKSTAVVGYIAIVDLTKAGDIIRSRTYDAFFPLIVVALVYLLTTGLIVLLFDQINALTDKRLQRERRKKHAEDAGN